MLFLNKEDSLNLKRIADALCKLASIEVINKDQQPSAIEIEVHDESLETLAAREEERSRERLNEKLSDNNSEAFWPEDNLSLEELDLM